LSVLDDLSVTGFDDIPIAAFTFPERTTVAQPFDQMAARATKRLLARIKKTSRQEPTSGTGDGHSADEDCRQAFDRHHRACGCPSRVPEASTGRLLFLQRRSPQRRLRSGLSAIRTLCDLTRVSLGKEARLFKANPIL
jgi:Periplasmic binding protein-like domain